LLEQNVIEKNVDMAQSCRLCNAKEEQEKAKEIAKETCAEVLARGTSKRPRGQ